MKIIVTGGAGFVGSSIVRALAQAGHAVTVLDDLSTGHVENLSEKFVSKHTDVRSGAFLEHVEFVEADAGAPSSAKHFERADGVIHCAAYADVSKNWEGDERTKQWDMNAELTRRVLEHTSARAKGARFLLLSTCSVYGPGRVNEASTPTATSPYAASKIAAEALVDAYRVGGRVRGTIFRCVNVVGPRYRHGHVADFVASATKNGWIHAVDDGEKKKSFVHAFDVAREAERVMSSQIVGTLHNLTSPYVWSWRDTIAVMRAMRPDKPFDLTWESRASGWIGDPHELVVTSRELEAEPRTSIVEGVAQALEGLGW